jgi:hypothetical protein
MLGGSVEVGMKNNLYQFSEGQTHLGMPRGATLSLASMHHKCSWMIF